AAFLILQPAPDRCEPGEKEGALLRRKAVGNGTTVIEAQDGTVYG
ncbi:MAG: sulfite exporter TauE/SafE family protein, partial [Gemmatimonadetes bacterium]|nr:sulfite exporter TauE/SafE family protein [Gemmatimonadota bacterium]NIR79213.1 sulfite exporter TauE/SafE family protein [Gemmatimonadota bacterium]NIT87874.1 sulfite exporter TauE/SafE family protein [Gemmatimonadota bacterium]NIU31729.1 sulfite exporter TauE/SafE family protein [Gemmatimonadota bacterium]NIU36346.1 sulfite exporter TauE/SafE family protein [Gemmatimonadota bacterium]